MEDPVPGCGLNHRDDIDTCILELILRCFSPTVLRVHMKPLCFLLDSIRLRHKTRLVRFASVSALEGSIGLEGGDAC